MPDPNPSQNEHLNPWAGLNKPELIKVDELPGAPQAPQIVEKTREQVARAVPDAMPKSAARPAIFPKSAAETTRAEVGQVLRSLPGAPANPAPAMSAIGPLPLKESAPEAKPSFWARLWSRLSFWKRKKAAKRSPQELMEASVRLKIETALDNSQFIRNALIKLGYAEADLVITRDLAQLLKKELMPVLMKRRMEGKTGLAQGQKLKYLDDLVEGDFQKMNAVLEAMNDQIFSRPS